MPAFTIARAIFLIVATGVVFACDSSGVPGGDPGADEAQDARRVIGFSDDTSYILAATVFDANLSEAAERADEHLHLAFMNCLGLSAEASETYGREVDSSVRYDDSNSGYLVTKWREVNKAFVDDGWALDHATETSSDYFFEGLASSPRVEEALTSALGAAQVSLSECVSVDLERVETYGEEVDREVVFDENRGVYVATSTIRLNKAFAVSR